MGIKNKIISTPLTEKLLEFGLCSPNGEKMRHRKIIHDTKNKPIPDEKWLTLTQYISNLEDLRMLANKAVADYKNWQNILNAIRSLLW